MSDFVQLTTEEEILHVQYQAAIWKARYIHIEATSSFAISEVIARQIEQLKERPEVKKMAYTSRTRFLSPLVMRQAAATKRAMEARTISRQYAAQAKQLRSNFES